MAEAIILAAGKSSRAKTNKMMLRVNGMTIIEHSIASLSPFVKKIFVVTGHTHEALHLLLKNYPNVEIIQNNDYELGMFSSVLKGVKWVNDDFFILPGDCPFIKPKTITSILAASGKIRVPTYQMRRGHPLWIDLSLKELLLKEPLNSSLKVFRDRFEVNYIQTNDRGVLTDIDTLEDYQKQMDYMKEANEIED